MKPQEVIDLHRQICEAAKCPHIKTLNFADPCTGCPEGHWGRYMIRGCEDVNAPTPTRTSTAELDLRPGTIFSRIIFQLTGQVTSMCARCMSRSNQMSEWGWIGCWKNRKIIVGWLVEEARLRGHQITRANALGLFIAAYNELKKKR